MSLTVQDGIIVGAVGGFLAGLTVWFSQLIKEKLTTEIHKKRVYDWLYKKTLKGKGLTGGSAINDPRWVSTEEIACFTYLPKDRVRYICSIHKKIRPKLESDLWKDQPLEEMWAIREFVEMLEP
jgi:hypothetical protein